MKEVYRDLRQPPDDASRGLDACSLLSRKRWFPGPELLWRSRIEWPEQLFAMGDVPEDDPEVKNFQSMQLAFKWAMMQWRDLSVTSQTGIACAKQ